ETGRADDVGFYAETRGHAQYRAGVAGDVGLVEGDTERRCGRDLRRVHRAGTIRLASAAASKAARSGSLIPKTPSRTLASSPAVPISRRSLSPRRWWVVSRLPARAILPSGR